MDVTPRLAQIVALVGGQGYSYREVADELGISYRTVVFHAERARRRASLVNLKPRDALARLYHEAPAAWDLMAEHHAHL